MHNLNFTLETDELNLFVEYFRKIKSQPEVVYAASWTDVRSSSSATTQHSDVAGESSSLETYKTTYLNLPHHLKSCLDYCSFITERYHEDKEKLVQLLAAEGLIVQDNSDDVLEDIAISIIEELISLEMLEQYPLDHEHVRVPPPLVQLCNESAEKEELVAEAANLPIRLYILDDGTDNLAPHLNALPIKSLFVVTKRQGLTRAYMEAICKVKSLEVLDLNGNIECLPDEIGNLVNLRYLCLNYSYIKELPWTMRKLQNLQTLVVRFYCSYELPVEVLDIQQVRHLILSKSTNVGEIRVPKKIGEMKNLQTLRGVYAGDCIANELGKLTQLQVLEVVSIAEDHASELSAAIMKLPNLVSLSLCVEIAYLPNTVERSVFPEMEAFSPPPLIQEVTLSGQLVEIPNWLLSLQDLTKLCLYGSCLRDDLTSEIQFLPNLKHLSLWNTSEAKRIGKEFCVAGGFPKLETLKITSHFLVEWTEIANGAFPSLKSLILRNCISFRFFPNGLEYIRTLKELLVIPAYIDLKGRLEGKENYKIRNVPFVCIS